MRSAVAGVLRGHCVRSARPLGALATPSSLTPLITLIQDFSRELFVRVHNHITHKCLHPQTRDLTNLMF